jgi:hypothetical protein
LAVLQMTRDLGKVVVMHQLVSNSHLSSSSLAKTTHISIITSKPCTDCGIIHFHDESINKAPIKVSPRAKEPIETSKFG